MCLTFYTYAIIDKTNEFMHCIYVAGNVVTRCYLIYKWIMALFLFANQILSLTLYTIGSSGHPGRAGKYMIYATHWGFVLIVAALNLDAILVLARYIIQVTFSDKGAKNTPKLPFENLKSLKLYYEIDFEEQFLRLTWYSFLHRKNSE